MPRGKEAEERGKDIARKDRVVERALKDDSTSVDRDKPGESAGTDKPGKGGNGK